MLNIHPSILPLFPGLDTHARALAAGMAVHGCTVHEVTTELDSGPILGQAVIPVVPGDTPATLAARPLRRAPPLPCGAAPLRATARPVALLGPASPSPDPASGVRGGRRAGTRSTGSTRRGRLRRLDAARRGGSGATMRHSSGRARRRSAPPDRCSNASVTPRRALAAVPSDKGQIEMKKSLLATLLAVGRGPASAIRQPGRTAGRRDQEASDAGRRRGAGRIVRPPRAVGRGWGRRRGGRSASSSPRARPSRTEQP